MKNFTLLDRLSLGERDGGVQSIDAGCFPGSVSSHGDIARVVVRLEDHEEDYEPGVELTRRILALPALISALKEIRDAESVYEAQTTALNALKEAGL